MSSRLLLDSRDIDGAWVCPHFLNPAHEVRLLSALDSRGQGTCTPAEDMDGEVMLPIIWLNWRDSAGPAWTQIMGQDELDDREERY